ncbi:hypothetical protein DB728_16115 [Rhizobium leguminosarum bv. viciae USDA 2370]|nr:hypothetical protein BS629_28140 [Rhizobium leguminosarum bv. viciae USDA 2370]PUB63232.1 hypothetical protein DB728_16115 [Rhizobium leguminosarum bv. viciae USDA 2370]
MSAAFTSSAFTRNTAEIDCNPLWTIGSHRLDVWVKGIQPISYVLVDEITRTVISSVTVKGRSTETVIALMESALTITAAPRSIRTSDLNLIRDEGFQEWVLMRGIQVLYISPFEPLTLLSSGEGSDRERGKRGPS